MVLEEAVAAARRVDEGEPRRAELLIRVLGAYQRELCELGRRAEAFAVREQMASIARLEYQAGRTEGVRAGLEALAAGLAEGGGTGRRRISTRRSSGPVARRTNGAAPASGPLSSGLRSRRRPGRTKRRRRLSQT